MAWTMHSSSVKCSQDHWMGQTSLYGSAKLYSLDDSAKLYRCLSGECQHQQAMCSVHHSVIWQNPMTRTRPYLHVWLLVHLGTPNGTAHQIDMFLSNSV